VNAIELLDMISVGETSKVQFKRELPSPESMSRELVAMANGSGGKILFGIEDKVGTIIGLMPEQIEYADRKVAEFADNLKPPIYIATDVIKIEQDGVFKNVLIIHISEGINKPYKTAQGEIYVKQGSNKRLLTDNAEIMRLFQASGKLFADEMLVYRTTIDDINKDTFVEYFKKEFGKTFEQKGLTFEEALKAKRVLISDQLTLAGLLFFGKDPQCVKPVFTIKAVSFFGNDISGNQYRNKPEDLKGTIPQLFEGAMRYLRSSLYHLQNGQNVNYAGNLEISDNALVEVVQNALVHRDYFKNSPIRIFIFDDRVEIISPGKLPNSLTVEDIRYGNMAVRNNQIAMFSSHTLPYAGLGSGLKRAISEQPDIEFINDERGEQFIVKIPRKQIS
jgi:predicted HTH transcriptional regulator